MRKVVSFPSHLTVSSVIKQKRYGFDFRVFRSDCVEDQQIEPDFYREHAKQLYDGRHFEIEIISHDFVGNEHEEKFHIHRSRGRNFICWTGSIPNLYEAQKVMRLWSVGTAYTAELGLDFARIPVTFPVEENDFWGIRNILGEKFGFAWGW